MFIIELFFIVCYMSPVSYNGQSNKLRKWNAIYSISVTHFIQHNYVPWSIYHSVNGVLTSCQPLIIFLWHYDVMTWPHHWPFVMGIHLQLVDFPPQRASDAERWYFLCCEREQLLNKHSSSRWTEMQCMWLCQYTSVNRLLCQTRMKHNKARIGCVIIVLYSPIFSNEMNGHYAMHHEYLWLECSSNLR